MAALRDAAIIIALPVRSSPPRAVKKQKVANLLFRGEAARPVEDSPGVTAPGSQVPEEGEDPVMDEVKRWELLPLAEIKPFYDEG